jgi:hypothetical protein
MPGYDVKEVCGVLTKCGKLLLSRPPQAEAAWRAIEPYIECTEIRGQFLLGNESLIQMVLAVAGDIQAELHHPEEAAYLYREALAYDGSFAFADGYAKVVLENNFDEHICSALAAIQRSNENWRKRTALDRTLSWILWGFLVARHPHVWREWREARCFRKQLESRPSASTSQIKGR